MTQKNAAWLFYYDGACGFCRRVAGIIEKLDITNKLGWLPYQSLETPPAGLTWSDLEAAAYLQSGGRLEGGFYAFRRLSLGLPLLLPLGLLMSLPGVHIAGEAAYGWVARNRGRLTAAGCEAISVGDQRLIP